MFVLFMAILAGLILVWDIVVASRGAQARPAAPVLRALTALIGILLAPGLLVAVADSSLLTARLAQQLWWLWPATVAGATIQSAWVAARQPVSVALALPLVVWNTLLLLFAVARALPERGISEPEWLGAVAAAMLHAFAAAAGQVALTSPFMLLPPLLAPSLPSRWRPVAILRACVSAMAVLATLLVLSRLPGAVDARRSYLRYEPERVQAHLPDRPAGDLAIGLRILSRVDRAPSPYALRVDLALAESLQARALFVRVAKTSSLATLDSLARALEPLRHDSVQLALGLALESGDDAEVGLEGRAAERLVRRLRPELFVIDVEPATRSSGRGVDQFAQVEETARGARAGFAGVRTIVAIDPLMPDARAWFTWVRTRARGVAAVGVVLRTGSGGAIDIDEQMAMVSQWIASQPSDRPTWITSVTTAPVAHGEAAQALAWRAVLAWASRTPEIHGVLAGPASDYGSVTGLRAASGRLRPAARVVAAVSRGLREGRATPTATPP